MYATFKSGIVPLSFEYKGHAYQGRAVPVTTSCRQDVCFELDIYLNDEYLGQIHSYDGEWLMPGVEDQELINAIGERILLWYE